MKQNIWKNILTIEAPPQQLACYWIRSKKFLTIGYQASNQRLTLWTFPLHYTFHQAAPHPPSTPTPTATPSSTPNVATLAAQLQEHLFAQSTSGIIRDSTHVQRIHFDSADADRTTSSPSTSFANFSLLEPFWLRYELSSMLLAQLISSTKDPAAAGCVCTIWIDVKLLLPLSDCKLAVGQEPMTVCPANKDQTASGCKRTCNFYFAIGMARG